MITDPNIHLTKSEKEIFKNLGKKIHEYFTQPSEENSLENIKSLINLVIFHNSQSK